MSMSLAKRRLGVVINYGWLLMFLAFFLYGKMGEWNIVAITGTLISILIIIGSCIIVYGKTGLWRMVHSKIDNLDERQLMVTYESLRHSYSIFSISCLLIVIIADILIDESLFGIEVPLLPIFLMLYYLAHVLPASILAWTEKEV